MKIIPKDSKHFAKRTNTDFIDFGGVEQSPDARIPGHPFTDRVLRLLAETSGDRSRIAARTDDDVSGGSGRLRATPGDSAPLALDAISGDAVRFLR